MRVAQALPPFSAWRHDRATGPSCVLRVKAVPTCVGQVLRSRRAQDLEVELAGLDLGEVEDVVDDVQQQLARSARMTRIMRFCSGSALLHPAPPTCPSRRSSACGSRGSCWRGTRSWRRSTSRADPESVRGPRPGTAPLPHRRLAAAGLPHRLIQTGVAEELQRSLVDARMRRSLPMISTPTGTASRILLVAERAC
jgi:hypothetical protein